MTQLDGQRLIAACEFATSRRAAALAAGVLCLLLTGCGPGWERPYRGVLPADFSEQDRLRIDLHRGASRRPWEGALVARAKSESYIQPTIIIMGRGKDQQQRTRRKATDAEK